MLQENKARQIFWKEEHYCTFLTLWYAHLVTPVLRLAFLPYCRWSFWILFEFFLLTIYCSRFYCLVKTQMNRSFACQGTRQFHFLFKILQGNISIHCHIQPGLSVAVTLFRIPVRNLIQNNKLCTYPLDAGGKLNIHKTFLGRLLNVSRMFNLYFVSGGGSVLTLQLAFTCMICYISWHFWKRKNCEMILGLDSVTTVFITDIGVSKAIMVSRKYLT